MIVYQCAQRSAEWHALRAGRVTGSMAEAILAVRKRGTGELAIRADLRDRLTVERMTGMSVSDDLPYLPKDMARGIEYESLAIGAYEAMTGELVSRCGFAAHDELLAGCSPDGYVGEWDGVLEVKCPSSAVHLSYVRAGVVPPDYYPQMVHALWITGAQWADFVSFDDRFQDPALRLFVVRLARSAVDLAAYELAVRLLLSEVDHAVSAMQERSLDAVC